MQVLVRIDVGDEFFFCCLKVLIVVVFWEFCYGWRVPGGMDFDHLYR